MGRRYWSPTLLWASCFWPGEIAYRNRKAPPYHWGLVPGQTVMGRRTDVEGWTGGSSMWNVR